MMNCFRITKYNPAFRNANGSYNRNEWTSYSDIGEFFPDGLLTKEEYQLWENRYLDVISHLAEEYHIDYFIPLRKENMPTIPSTISLPETLNLARRILREECWCILHHPKLEISFGYDYYMYIRCENISNALLEKIRIIGLYAEKGYYPSYV